MLSVIVIFKHVHDCVPVYPYLVKLPNLLNCNYSTGLVHLIYGNYKVIDRSNDWSFNSSDL